MYGQKVRPLGLAHDITHIRPLPVKDGEPPGAENIHFLFLKRGV